MLEENLSLADRWMLQYEAEHPVTVSKIRRQNMRRSYHGSDTMIDPDTALQSNNQGSACLLIDPSDSDIGLDPVVEAAIQTRKALKLTQESFSRCLGISARTLRDWEQGRRRPSGAAMTLLAWASSRPEFVRDLSKLGKSRNASLVPNLY